MSKIIKCGIRYFNSNREVLTEKDKIITDTIYDNSANITSTISYEEKLTLWRKLNLNEKTAYWIGDFNKIKFEYNKYYYPEPDCFVSVYPINFEQVIKLNLLNINAAIDELEDFVSYKTNRAFS